MTHNGTLDKAHPVSDPITVDASDFATILVKGGGAGITVLEYQVDNDWVSHLLRGASIRWLAAGDVIRFRLFNADDQSEVLWSINNGYAAP